VLALSGTLAIHTILVVAADAVVVTHPIHVEPPAPHIELVNIEQPRLLKPLPPPPVAAKPEVKPDTTKHVVNQARAIRTTQPRTEPVPVTPPRNPADPPSGGTPTMSMPDIAPAASGVEVTRGPRADGQIGRGGTGTGTGAGSGSGVGETPAPMSVATIKTRAMPHGDYSYIATTDYPTEAKQLGIEGPIRVKLVVDEHGRVKSAVLLNHLGHGLDELALQRAQAIQFDPAQDTNDRPVTSVVIWTFTMTLPR